MHISWLTSSRLYRLVLPLAFGLAFAYVLTGIWNNQGRSRPVAPRTEVPAMSGPARESWTAVILEHNILGLAVPDQEPTPPAPVLDEDSFAPRLLGTVVGTRPKALIRENEEVLILELGAQLQGWELAEVDLRSVVFTSGSRRKVVPLWDDPPDAESGETAAGLQNVSSPPWAIPASRGGRISLSREEVQPMLSDPNTLLQMASFKPFTVDGRVSGFQVFSIRPDSLLHKVGLRNGDILARINGQTLTGPTQLLQAYSGMDRASLITLDVQRASQMQTYLIELN